MEVRATWSVPQVGTLFLTPRDAGRRFVAAAVSCETCSAGKFRHLSQPCIACTGWSMPARQTKAAWITWLGRHLCFMAELLAAKPVNLARSRRRLPLPALPALGGNMPARQGTAAQSARRESFVFNGQLLTAKFVVAASLRLALLPASAAARPDSPFKPAQFTPRGTRVFRLGA